MTEETSMNFLKNFIDQKKNLNEKRLKQFISAEKTYILPKNNNRKNLSKILKTDKNMENFDQNYERIYTLLQKTISNKCCNPEKIMISQFESEELKKMLKHKKFIELKNKFNTTIAGLSTKNEGFLSKLMNFENTSSMNKLMNWKLQKLNHTLKLTESSKIMEKNKSLHN